ncbi:MAG: RHS repeat-associated core domain-containing protein [Isosphaeraceae bacterium]|nr:RHS repeat-associated core domain-containing protein [Isosphaeraceae bacterium]
MGTTTTLATYVYDAFESVIQTTHAGATRATLYDGQTPHLDFNGSGSVTARYLSIPNAIDELLARETSAGVAWYLRDRLGSVRDVVDNSGTVIDHVDYSAFGQVISESNPANGDRFKYAGMERDPVTGLHYVRARWYDPAAGKFLNPDPLGFAGREVEVEVERARGMFERSRGDRSWQSAPGRIRMERRTSRRRPVAWGFPRESARVVLVFHPSERPPMTVLGVAPHLVVHDASGAVDFYIAALGAVEVRRMASPDGKKLWHAELSVGPVRLLLADEFPEMGGPPAPATLGGTPVVIHLDVDDCDAAFHRAVAAGAQPAMAPMDAFWGDRYAVIIDPFGHRWSFAHRLETVDEAELQRRGAEIAAQGG